MTTPCVSASEHPDHGLADYEILAELSSGPLGALRLASIERGRDAGRLVRLRKVGFELAAPAARSVEAGVRVAHARLLKVLGLAVVNGELNVASEFVEGATLWDLQRAAADRKQPISQAVALRIVSDLLWASVAARAAFSEAGERPVQRCIWPDTAWIATFGETLLSEPALAPTLAASCPAARPYLSPEESRGEPGGAQSDVFAAGVLLWELFANRPLFGGDAERVIERVQSDAIPRLGETGNFGDPVAAAVADIGERALARDLAKRYSGPEEMANAIAALPKELVASDDDVQRTLEALVHIESQRRTSSGVVPSYANHDQDALWDIPTRSLRVPRALLGNDRVTLRPSELAAAMNEQNPEQLESVPNSRRDTQVGPPPPEQPVEAAHSTEAAEPVERSQPDARRTAEFSSAPPEIEILPSSAPALTTTHRLRIVALLGFGVALAGFVVQYAAR